MKKTNYLLGVLAVFSALSFSACSDKDNDSYAPEVVNGKVDNGTFTPSTLAGVVCDANGRVMKGVTVTNGSQAVTTDANGVFSFDKVATVKGRSVLTFKKSGYVEIVRAMPEIDGDLWKVVMFEEYGASVENTSFSAGETKTMSLIDLSTYNTAIKVDLPANYKDATTGKAYASGAVNARMVYLDPDADNFAEAMPGGDLAAVREDGSDAQLVSYGMVKMELTGGDGQKLQLADGEEATITFGVPSTFESQVLPEKIPLWSFNETTGLWEEEGEATLTDGVYVGKVKHFSWWNLDYPYSRAELKVTVKNKNGKVLPYIKVDVDGQRNLTTKADGTASCFIPSGLDIFVKIHSEDYGGYTPEITENLNVPAGTAKEITLTLPTVSVISGKVTNKGAGSKIVSVYIGYQGKYTEKVVSDIFGRFSITAPFGYTGAATLYAKTSDGKVVQKDITISDKDQTVNFEIDSNSSAIGGGSIVVTEGSTGDAVTYTLPEIKADLGNGVVILDSMLVLSYWKQEQDPENFSMEMLTLSIPNYDKKASKFSNVMFSYMLEGNETGYMNIYAESCEVTVSQSGDKYTFKITNAPCGFYGSNVDYSDSAVYKLTAEVVAPLSVTAHSVRNAKKSSNLFPSFMPYIDNQTFDAMVIDKCTYISKGGCAYYKDSLLTKTHYDNLVAAGKKTFGNPVQTREPSEQELQWGYEYETYFYKDGKLLGITYNPNYQPQYYQHYGHEGLNVFEDDGIITVTALEGLTIDYKLFFDDEQNYRARKRFAAKSPWSKRK